MASFDLFVARLVTPALLGRSDSGLYRRTEAKATAFWLEHYGNEVLGIAQMNIARYAV